MSNVYQEPEGAAPLDPDEIEGIRFTHIQTREQLNELEQVNIQEGMQWLKKQQNADPLSEHFVCELHKKLFGKVWRWAGTFRTSAKNIGCDASYISMQLRDLLDDTRYWIENNTYPPIEIAARFHHRLVAIHLFPNGNGRHARILADALLTIMMKADPIDWTGGEDMQSMSKQRKKYIAALKSADQGDFQPLLEFVSPILVKDC